MHPSQDGTVVWSATVLDGIVGDEAMVRYASASSASAVLRCRTKTGVDATVQDTVLRQPKE